MELSEYEKAPRNQNSVVVSHASMSEQDKKRKWIMCAIATSTGILGIVLALVTLTTSSVELQTLRNLQGNNSSVATTCMQNLHVIPFNTTMQ